MEIDNLSREELSEFISKQSAKSEFNKKYRENNLESFKKYYDKIKDKEDFKAKRIEYAHKYYLENRDKILTYKKLKNKN
jgi:hypothetical protein